MDAVAALGGGFEITKRTVREAMAKNGHKTSDRAIMEIIKTLKQQARQTGKTVQEVAERAAAEASSAERKTWSGTGIGRLL